MKNDLPRNTVIRLSQYRRLLEKYSYLEEPYIFSHDLARMLDIKPVKVRHDLMLLGINGDRTKGYNVNALLDRIGSQIEKPDQHIILIGLGRLGLSILEYLEESHANLRVSAAFDIDPNKINKAYEAVKCYSISELASYVKKHQRTSSILAVPTDDVGDILPIMIDAGIRGILNYTSVQLNVPEDVRVRNIDIVSFLEEINYFISDPK